MGKALDFKQGMKVRCTNGATIYQSDINVSGLEGYAVGRIGSRLLIKLSPDSIAKLFAGDFSVKNMIVNQELIIVEIQHIEVIVPNSSKTDYEFRSAYVGGGSFLVGAIFFSIIALIAGLISYVNTMNILFPKPNHIGEFWAALVPGIVAIILFIVIINFVKTFIIGLRIKSSKYSFEAEIIDMNYYRIGRSDYCSILYIIDKLIIYEKISYSKFIKYNVGDKIRVKSLSANSKYYCSA